MRLIDADAVELGFDELCRSPYFKHDVNAKHGAETLMDVCVRTDSHMPNIIDPETIPTVRQLREELARVTAERDAALRELRSIQTHTRSLRDYVENEIHPVVDYSIYLNLREAVDTIDSWQHITPDGAIKEARP